MADTNTRLNNAWQRVRLYIPNMMNIYNNSHATNEKQLWEKIQEETDVNAIIDAVEDLAEVDTETARKWVYDRICADTWHGAMMQEYAKKIISQAGYQAATATEQQDREGIDLIATDGKRRYNIQIKPLSFFKSTDKICRYKRQVLRDRCRKNNIYIMVYDYGHFLKWDGKKYLHNIDNLLNLWQK